MTIGRTIAIAVNGIRGDRVDVEADISAGLPSFVLIGLPDAALGEARDRVRSSAHNSGCPITSKKLTVNLSPASLPKYGSAFDLAIAVAALAAAGDIDRTSSESTVHIGELALDGRLRPISGVLPAVTAAVAMGHRRVIVPTANAAEAALVGGAEVVPAASLREVAIFHGGAYQAVPVQPLAAPSVQESALPIAELADVVGNARAVRALIVAAAGAHHMFMVGPPGAGKTLLAERLPGLLPDLDDERALEATSIRSLGAPVSRLIRRPPIEAPHHTTGPVAMVGGGSGRIRPGAAVRAVHGVLFLDEAPEFSAAALDTLRQPLEAGTISIHRVAGVISFPGRFQLVLAANPCPCGQFGSADGMCVCTPHVRRRYLARISGPLLDRLDIQIRVERVTATQLALAADPDRAGGAPTTTAQARAEVEQARSRAARRLAATPWTCNAHVSGSWLRGPDNVLAARDRRALDAALESGAITMRGYDRVLRLAWTCADLERRNRPEARDVGAALALRRSVR